MANKNVTYCLCGRILVLVNPVTMREAQAKVSILVSFNLNLQGDLQVLAIMRDSEQEPSKPNLTTMIGKNQIINFNHSVLA